MFIYFHGNSPEAPPGARHWKSEAMAFWWSFRGEPCAPRSGPLFQDAFKRLQNPNLPMMFMDVYGRLWMFMDVYISVLFFFTIDYSDNHITCWICLMEVWGLLELAITTVGVKIWLNVVHVNVPMFLQPCWSHHSKLNTFMGTNLSPNQKWPWLWSPLKWGIPTQMDTHGWNWGNQICPVLLRFQVSIEVLDFLFGSKNGSPAAKTLSPLTWAGMGHLGMDQDPRPIGNLLVGRTTHFCIVGSSCLNHAGLGLSSYVFNFCLNHLEESSTSLFRVLMRDHWEMPRCQFQPSHPPFSCKNQDHSFFAIDFLVGGLEHLDTFGLFFSWECHHPNWRTPWFFRGVVLPPTSFITL